MYVRFYRKIYHLLYLQYFLQLEDYFLLFCQRRNNCFQLLRHPHQALHHSLEIRGASLNQHLLRPEVLWGRQLKSIKKLAIEISFNWMILSILSFFNQQIYIIFTWIMAYKQPSNRKREGTRFSIFSSVKNFPSSSLWFEGFKYAVWIWLNMKAPNPNPPTEKSIIKYVSNNS